ncbi:GTP-binding protein rhb1 [Smittium culicis]|uniref:GTP-binding protein rhb1 n=1 Tax=Smittium culicis TaxID=133412 RepID=A0A1R1XVR6_9FUNG|nr:GTP-binding protein rhb1 [Smittium culicis]OMJ28886.1 GTP-binding protein rhb1 [Smittium culicis]
MDFEKIRKLVVLGHRGVGKTSLILRYTENTFVDNYYPTIEDIHTKTVTYNNNQYKLSIVDTAGQDEFSMLNPQYTIGVDLYVIVFSVASSLSFDMVRTIRDKILDQTGLDTLPMVLVGSKSDLDYARQVSKEDAYSISKEFDCSYIECSAKTEVNIDAIFQHAISEKNALNNSDNNGQTSKDNNAASNCSLM